MAHSATPTSSASARAVDFWRALVTQAEAWNAEHQTAALFDEIQPSLRSINSRSDGFTEVCEMEIGYRLPPGLAPDEMASMVQSVARTLDASVTLRGAESAYIGPRSGKLVCAFIRALRAEGLEPSFKRKTGTSDMNVVAPVWRCPIVAYGPGDASLDHTPQEHIEMSEFFQGVAVLERMLTELVMEEITPC
jgi:LysW-gamma-L-lysine carboxypeptidase